MLPVPLPSRCWYRCVAGGGGTQHPKLKGAAKRAFGGLRVERDMWCRGARKPGLVALPNGRGRNQRHNPKRSLSYLPQVSPPRQ